MELTCQQVKSKLDAGETFLLLDCRETTEHELANIAGATLIPMSELGSRVGELETERESEIVVYCHHGQRSLHVANWLKQQGFNAVKSMAGGIEQWSLEIDPQVPRYG